MIASSSLNTHPTYYDMDPNLSIHVVPPAVPFHASAPSHTIIFLHDRGSSAHNLVDTFGLFPDAHGNPITRAFPTVRWVFPGPMAKPREPASQWFRAAGEGSPQDEEEQAEGLCKYGTSICQLIHREAYHLHGRYDRIVLAGVGQGAAVATHSLLNLNISTMPKTVEDRPLLRRIGAFMAFGGSLPFPGRGLAETRAVLQIQGAPAGDDNEVVCNTPMLLEHCDDNSIVPVADGKVLRDTLRGFGAGVAFYEYVGGGQWFNTPSGIENAIACLEQALGLRRKVP